MRARRPLLPLLMFVMTISVRCDNTEADTSSELDEDGDSAPYAVAVELAGGGRCAGSLVAARTVLTSAGCARGRPARALTAGGSRRVRRAVTARGAAESASDEPAAGWGGALMDLAVLVLDKAPAPPARSISMATDAAQCEAPHTACVVAGSLASPGERRVSLRVSDATVAEGATCSSRARFWASIKDHALCLAGPKLCASDRGAGVVCSGRLCGVVSRSLGGAGDAGAEGCGYTHAVQSLPRWRRFLHCAHSQHGCRSEQCTELCTETELLRETRVEEQELTSPGSAHPPPIPDDYDTAPSLVTSDPKDAPLSSGPTELRKKAEDKIDIVTPLAVTVTAPPRHRPSRPRIPSFTSQRHLPPTRSPAVRRQRPRSEYEPNRPDFRAGEYGDTVVDYGESEEAHGTPGPLDPLGPSLTLLPHPAHFSPHPVHPTHTEGTHNTTHLSAAPTRVTAPPERLVSVPTSPPTPLSSGASMISFAPLHTWLVVAALSATVRQHTVVC